jgi:hypothetical protein
VNDKNWQQSEGRALEGDVGRYGERRERKRGRKRNERIRNLRRRKRLEVDSKRKLEWGKINNDQQGVPCRDRRYIGARGSALVCASACLSISSQLHGGALFGRQAWGGGLFVGAESMYLSLYPVHVNTSTLHMSLQLPPTIETEL